MLRFFLAFFILTTVQLAEGKDLKSYQIYTSNGKSVDFDKLLKTCQNKRFIFFGEYHNNPIAHWLQFELLRELHVMKKQRLVVGAEMFEADNQFIIDEYLQDQISAKNFQDEVRLWPNYNTDYKPIVEYVKANKLAFIATNIPRRYANMVYKKGLNSLENLSETAKSYIVPLADFKFDKEAPGYAEIIKEMGDHGGESLAIAQAIKDATMAHFILKNTAEKESFYHLNGAFHSDNYTGILYYLKQKVDPSSILTISTIEQKDITEWDDDNEELADFVICVTQNMTKTH